MQTARKIALIIVLGFIIGKVYDVTDWQLFVFPILVGFGIGIFNKD